MVQEPWLKAQFWLLQIGMNSGFENQDFGCSELKFSGVLCWFKFSFNNHNDQHSSMYLELSLSVFSHVF